MGEVQAGQCSWYRLSQGNKHGDASAIFVMPFASTVTVCKSSLELKKIQNEDAEPEGSSALSYKELFLGNWERALAWRDDDFSRDEGQNPHIHRRRAIMKAHPIVRKLYQNDFKIAWVILLGVLNQLLLAWLFRNTKGFFEWIRLFTVALVFGGSFANLMAICVHECVHGLVTKDYLMNKLLALLCNVGTPVPIAMSFRRYHSDHHVYQGSETKDPDMPLKWELELIHGTFFRKLCWLTVYPAMYAIRAIVRGKTVTDWEVINLVFTITCDVLFYLVFGIKSCAYLIISFLFGYTFHPAAAHFLQEHYTFTSGQETYNYYGWANTLFLNIGFHYEHHDFPAVPARLLPFITLIAPEYYQPLMAHHSWRKVLWSFLTDSNIGPQSRCARE